MLRTHNCGELRLEDADKKVALCGWVHRRRDHGKIVFIDLRDRFGITQLVFLPSNKEAYGRLREFSNEYVLKVEGKVNKRPAGTQNPKIPTGLIEIEVLQCSVISKSKLSPIEVGTTPENISEEVRFSFRFLDLRNPYVQEPFFIRHRMNKLIHTFFDKEGFLEIETPFLTKSTPEGARDFLVPSRLNPGEFYALPQSPQLFKQILMISGFDRYYQIVRCFRDEDLRRDRQPEFTQLDFEMSFVEEEDIFKISEAFFKYLLKGLRGLDIKIPFRRITYKEALEKYGSDKPDLRGSDKEEFSFVWVVDFPMFSYSEEEGRLVAEHHPFTNPKSEDLPLLGSDPSKVRARSYDLVINGTEIGSGSIRIHNLELQRKVFSILGISEEVYLKRFGFLLKALEFGAPPHGGFALGLDRLCSILAGRDSIRDVIAFPKTQKGMCPLTGAPSQVASRQLKELGIIQMRTQMGNTDGLYL